MSIPWIYITVSWVSVSWITSIILAYNGNVLIYIFIVIWIVLTICWSYTQYKESETIKIKVDFQKENDSYIFSIPYSLYKKEHPMISMVWPNYEPCWFDWPKEIQKNGTIILENATELIEDRYILIK